MNFKRRISPLLLLSFFLLFYGCSTPINDESANPPVDQFPTIQTSAEPTETTTPAIIDQPIAQPTTKNPTIASTVFRNLYPDSEIIKVFYYTDIWTPEKDRSDQKTNQQLFKLNHFNSNCVLQATIPTGFESGSVSMQESDISVLDINVHQKAFINTDKQQTFLIVYDLTNPKTGGYISFQLSINDNEQECIKDANAILELTIGNITGKVNFPETNDDEPGKVLSSITQVKQRLDKPVILNNKEEDFGTHDCSIATVAMALLYYQNIGVIDKTIDVSYEHLIPILRGDIPVDRDMSPDISTVENIAGNKLDLNVNYTSKDKFWNALVSNIDSGDPIFMVVKYGNKLAAGKNIFAHAILMIGYTEDNEVVYIDPWTGKQYTQTLDEFFNAAIFPDKPIEQQLSFVTFTRVK